MIECVIRCKPSDCGDLNVNAIARHLNVSVPHLSRDFKKNMKINLHKYLIREKIKCACFLLMQNQRFTVKQVAIILDFCSSDYFIKIFKKQLGTTPGKFRKMDNRFYGLKDRRKGVIDRRSGQKDRRARLLVLATEKLDSNFKKRRTSPKERRIGSFDRRKSPRNLINHFYP